MQTEHIHSEGHAVRDHAIADAYCEKGIITVVRRVFVKERRIQEAGGRVRPPLLSEITLNQWKEEEKSAKGTANKLADWLNDRNP